MFPISRFRVSGRSMEPNFREGDFVLVNKFAYLFAYLFGKPKGGDAVVCKHNGMAMLKRIAKIKSGKIYVAGDNERSSRFAVTKDVILGKVLFRVGRNQ